jgi:hypothetical protein
VNSGMETSRKKVPSTRFAGRNLLSREAVEAEQLGDSCLLFQGDRTCPPSSSAIEEWLRIPISWSCRCAPGGSMSELDKHTGHRERFRPKEIEQLISEAR